jgi:hypothetical protein
LAAAKKQQRLASRDWRTVTDEEVDEYVNRVSLGRVHCRSTCRMSLGPEDGVDDQRLGARGLPMPVFSEETECLNNGPGSDGHSI